MKLIDTDSESQKANFMRTGAIASFVISTFFLLPLIIFAQADHPYSVERLSDVGTNEDFVVGPGKAELEIEPGKSLIYNITVANRMGEAKIFQIEVEDFAGSNDPDKAVVLLGDERGPYSLKDYISVPAYEFTLQNGEKATIPVTVSIPADEEPGGRYGSVIVSTVSSKPDSAPTNASAAIISRIGVLFFVTVPGDILHEGILKEFRTKAGKKIFSGDKIPFEILFENSGSIHLNPYGELRINNWLGKEVGSLIIDPWFAMPNSLRFREVSWERSYLFGMYTASIQINRGYEDIIDSKNLTFFVFPWKLILPILGAIIALFMILKFLISKFEIRKKSQNDS